MQLKVATINILNDLSLWIQRRELLRDGLVEQKAHLICIQEANLLANTAGWLAESLGYQVYLCPKAGKSGGQEGIAVLSRLPIVERYCFDLGSQERVAQAVVVDTGDHEFVLANGHFFWQPGESQERLCQVERLVAWLTDLAQGRPVIVCGDFNATPETAAVQYISRSLTSAYAKVHGKEPDFTCPTPLPRSLLAYFKVFIHMFFVLRPFHLRPGWRGTLDYIFTSPGWIVQDCHLILNQPAVQNHRLYPSDHFGLLAELEWRR